MDYDVAAASLASPPASAPVASYRPSVAVQNLGIHAASVTGTLRIYDRDAGTLLFTMALTPTAVPVGTTRNALADQLWEPVAGDIGKAFLFIATVVYPEDQYLPNNNLGPVTVIVTAAPPPPPPPVEPHAAQHEEGGADEISLEGLTGKAAESQTPDEHASQHESGGADELSVTDLTGLLATPQTPTTHASSHESGGSDPISGIEPSAHKTSHQNGGDDELSVAGLSGLLADAQNPLAHVSTHKLGGTDKASSFLVDGAHDWFFSLHEECPLEEYTTLGEITLTSPAATVNPAGILVCGHVLVGIPDSAGFENGFIRAAIGGAVNNYTSEFGMKSLDSWQYISVPIIAWFPSPGAAASYAISLKFYPDGTVPLNAQIQSLHALIIM